MPESRLRLFGQRIVAVNWNELIGSYSQDPSKLVEKGVPGWLLRVVVGFLTNRTMTVKYKGTYSSVKSLPGGGPQGTLLGFILFIVLINDAGFEGQMNNAGDLLCSSRKNLKDVNELHLKFIDDLTIAEAINMAELPVIPQTERTQPDVFHARTGHILPPDQSRVQKQLNCIEKYSVDNQMKLNPKKTKAILFNQCIQADFVPSLRLDECELDIVEVMKLLGVIIQSDLKWSKNTEYMTKKAYKRLWMIRRLKNLGAKIAELIDLYIKKIRCVLEYAVPVWP